MLLGDPTINRSSFSASSVAHAGMLRHEADQRRSDQEAEQCDEGQDGDAGRGRPVRLVGRGSHRQREADRHAEAHRGKAEQRKRNRRAQRHQHQPDDAGYAANPGQRHRAVLSLQPVAAEATGRDHEGECRISEAGRSVRLLKHVAQEYGRPVGDRAFGHGDAEDEQADAEERQAWHASPAGRMLFLRGLPCVEVWQGACSGDATRQHRSRGDRQCEVWRRTRRREADADQAAGHDAKAPEAVAGAHDQPVRALLDRVSHDVETELQRRDRRAEQRKRDEQRLDAGRPGGQPDQTEIDRKPVEDRRAPADPGD